MTNDIDDLLERAGRRWQASQPAMPQVVPPASAGYRKRGLREAVLVAAAVAVIAGTSVAVLSLSDRSVDSAAAPVASSSAAGQSSILVPSREPSAQDPDADTIIGIAMKMAAANGDPDPQLIQWVYVPSSVVGFRALGLDGQPLAEQAAQPGAAVVVTGNFKVLFNDLGPGETQTNEVTTIAFFYNSSTNSVAADLIGNDKIDLSSYGEVFSR